jgi:hypothetical protein
MNPAPANAVETPKMGMSFPSARLPRGIPARKARLYTLMTRPRIASVAMSCTSDNMSEAEAMTATPVKKMSRQESGSHLERAKAAMANPRKVKNQHGEALLPLELFHGGHDECATDRSRSGENQEQCVGFGAFVKDGLYEDG